LFGFLKGKMGITVNKMSFSAGESITGTVTMELKKLVSARAVRISLIGEQKTTRMTANGMRTVVQQIYNFPLPLDGEKEYTTQPYTYNFELKAPQIPSTNIPGGVAGTAIKAAGFLMNGFVMGGAISWYLVADLDVPKGFDVAKKLQINIA